MSTSTRRGLLRTILILFVIADLLALASFVFNQWFDVPAWHAWGFAAVLALPITMLVMPLVERVLDATPWAASIPFAGNDIPGAGQ